MFPMLFYKRDRKTNRVILAIILALASAGVGTWLVSGSFFEEKPITGEEPRRLYWSAACTNKQKINDLWFLIDGRNFDVEVVYRDNNLDGNVDELVSLVHGDPTGCFRDFDHDGEFEDLIETNNNKPHVEQGSFHNDVMALSQGLLTAEKLNEAVSDSPREVF